MNSVTFSRIILAISLIGYGNSQKFEGSPCTLDDGSQGTCKNISYCRTIKIGLLTGTMGFNNIVRCSFQGAVQIACCADERPSPDFNENTIVPPNTDIVFNEYGTSPIVVGTPGLVAGLVPKKPSIKKPSQSYTKPNKIVGKRAESACKIYKDLPVAMSYNVLSGSPVSMGEFPWMAAIGYADLNNDIIYDCGGTLISDNFILTAAHCARSKRPPLMVRLGKVTLLTNDDDATPVDIKIAEIIRHENYKTATMKNDIALLRLAERVKFTEFIRPACLSTDLADVPSGTSLTITGWGSTSSEQIMRPIVLLKLNVKSMQLELCDRTLLKESGLRQPLDVSQCCAFDPTEKGGACQGDSGGPLQMFPETENIATIVGITSFGPDCNPNKLPTVYTRVAHYLDWIEPIVWPNL